VIETEAVSLLYHGEAVVKAGKMAKRIATEWECSIVDELG
jgi:hypothetical protein